MKIISILLAMTAMAAMCGCGKKASEQTAPQAEQPGEKASGSIMKKAEDMATDVTESVSEAVDDAVDAASDIAEDVAEKAAVAKDEVVKAAREIGDSAAEGAAKAADSAGEMVDVITAEIEDIVTNAQEAIKETAENITNSIRGERAGSTEAVPGGVTAERPERAESGVSVKTETETPVRSGEALTGSEIRSEAFTAEAEEVIEESRKINPHSPINE